MNPVLILGDEPRIVINIARSLHRRGVAVDVAAFSSDTPALRSKAIRQCLMLADPRQDPALSSAVLLEYIESHHYDQLIPASDTALALVSDHYVQLSALLYVTCPPPHIVHRVLNKSQTLRFAHDCDVPVPKAITTVSLKELDEHGPSLQFPVIAKPCDKGHQRTGTFKTRRFETIEKLREAFRDDPKFGVHNLIQEYCPGEGLGIEALMRGDEPLVLFQHRRLKELPSTGGVSVLAISEAVDPFLGDYAVRLLRAMKWEGVAMVEFRVDRRTHQMALMEVNGRYWGSLGLSILAGVDFPWYEWQLAHGRMPSIPQSYRVGVRWRWTSGMLERLSLASSKFAGETAPSHAVRDLWEGVKDCLPPTRDALWSMRDPAPAVRELSRTVMKRVKTSVKGWLRHRLPWGIVEWRRIHRTFGRRTGLVFATRRIERTLSLRRDAIHSPSDVKTILFVCYGNIIRSPMAAALLRRALIRMGREDVRVESAGLYAKPRRGADPRSIGLARESGVSLESHESTPISRDLVLRADLILVMDYLNEAELLARYPRVASKIFLLGAYRRCHWSQAEIDDPYRGTQEDIRRCYDHLESCVNELARHLQVPVGSTEQQVIHAHPVAF